MQDKLSAEEVAILIRARRLLKDRGLDPAVDIKTVCEHAGISRKTGYQWEKQYFDPAKQKERETLCEKLESLTVSHSKLEKEFDDVRFENEGRKIAWEIHEVDKYLAGKKKLHTRPEEKNDSLFTLGEPFCTVCGTDTICCSQYPD